MEDQPLLTTITRRLWHKDELRHVKSDVKTSRQEHSVDRVVEGVAPTIVVARQVVCQPPVQFRLRHNMRNLYFFSMQVIRQLPPSRACKAAVRLEGVNVEVTDAVFDESCS